MNIHTGFDEDDKETIFERSIESVSFAKNRYPREMREEKKKKRMLKPNHVEQVNLHRIQMWLASWLSGWMAGWMIRWLDGWMAGWLAGWLAGWQHNCK
uniref:Uncharacterized protein n=1 Tax=Glossina palpalis gambiensis TaxID=67801 RepID=A0A1B0B4P7_9MUSC